jgi:ATP-binding cassette subfamily B protein
MARRPADRLLLTAVRRGGGWVAVPAATSLLLAAGYLLLPAVMGRALDAVLRAHDAELWLGLTAAVVVLLVLADAADDLAGGAADARTTAWLRHRLLGHILALGPGATRRFPAGDLVSRLVGNASQTGGSASTLVRGVTELVPPLGALAALALIDPWLCVTFVAGLPLVALVVRAFVRDVSDLNENYFAVQGRIAARLIDALGGIRTIAAAGTVDREVARVLDPLPELHQVGVGTWRAFGRVSARDALLVPLLEVAVLAVAGWELAAGRITPGQMLAAGEYVLLATGVSSAVQAAGRLAFARGTASRLAELLGEPAPAYGSERLSPGDGRLEFRGVTVRAADGAAVLDGLDLTVPGQALLAVVGPSGSGKSLLAALPGRLLDPDDGEVLLDGVPVRRLAPGELRKAVAYGFEQPVLLGETLGDAIRLGAPHATAEEVATAATAARAAPFIRRLPGGYGTPAAGAPLSGGETQRVGLARAFAQAGRVLVLDDVAAGLDTVTEYQIGEALTGALAGRTRLVVTHRAATAARADLVVWLVGGRVRARGRHEELWADPGYRAALRAGAPEDLEAAR